MEEKLTINDIAKMAGVAKSTVSRYLNGGSVRESTAQKIKSIIDEHHYEPNLFARLSAKNSQIIGLIVSGFNSVTTPRVVEVIVAELKINGYTPLIMHTNNDREEEIKSIIRLNNMNVDGIMIISAGISKKHIEVINNINIPILFIGQRHNDAHVIIDDNEGAGYAMGEYIAQQNLKNILLLWVDENDNAVGVERKQGILNSLHKHRITNINTAITTFFYQDTIVTLENYLKEHPIPEAILCATDRIAYAAYKVLSSKGIQIGKDISITGFGDYETSEILNPPLTTIKFDWNDLGTISTETMIKMIQGIEVSNCIIIPFEIKKRESVVESF